MARLDRLPGGARQVVVVLFRDRPPAAGKPLDPMLCHGRAAGSDTGSDEGLGGALEMGPLGNGQHDTQRTWPLATAKTGAAGLDVAVAAHGPQSDRGCPTARCVTAKGLCNRRSQPFAQA